MSATTTLEALIARERLPDSYKTIVERHWRPLSERIAEWRKDKAGPIVVGVNGAQGSGKSTLCVFLAEALLPALGLKAAVLSLDDFYLPKAARLSLSENIHPLFRTRGVPGTHDTAALCIAIDRLLNGESVSVPVFDKGADDRGSGNRMITGPVDVILVEGWCVGAPAQDDSTLMTPLNSLERNEDKDGRWRRYVNDRLAADYNDVFARLDRLILLRVDGMEAVLGNRLRQEHKLRAARPEAPSIMTDKEVKRFIEHYERITRHCLEVLPAQADIVIDVSALATGAAEN